MEAAPRFATLDQIVVAGRRDGTITKKNSPARNVHRLLNTLNFIAAIFENLAKNMGLKVSGHGCMVVCLGIRPLATTCCALWTTSS
jgi:hypothetical protein